MPARRALPAAQPGPSRPATTFEDRSSGRTRAYELVKASPARADQSVDLLGPVEGHATRASTRCLKPASTATRVGDLLVAEAIERCHRMCAWLTAVRAPYRRFCAWSDDALLRDAGAPNCRSGSSAVPPCAMSPTPRRQQQVGEELARCQSNLDDDHGHHGTDDASCHNCRSARVRGSMKS